MSEKKKDFFVATLNRNKKEGKQEPKQTSTTPVLSDEYFVSPSGVHKKKISILDGGSGNSSKRYDFLKGKEQVDISKISVGQGNNRPVILDNSKPGVITQVSEVDAYYDQMEEVSYPKTEPSYYKDESINDYREISTPSTYEEPEFIEEDITFQKVNTPSTPKPIHVEAPRPVVRGRRKNYKLPSVYDLPYSNYDSSNDEEYLNQKQEILTTVFRDFNISASVVDKIVGPTITQFLVKLTPGVRVNSVINLEQDIQRALALPKDSTIRIIPQVPGTPYLGVEVPNKTRKTVMLGDLIKSKEFQDYDGRLPIAVGLDVSGKPVLVDITEMPHCLIAGTTQSGKSVSINTIILSLLYKCTPEDLKLVLVDPKRVELSTYAGIPHLAMPVISNEPDFKGVMRWVKNEMENRYETLDLHNKRDIKSLNRYFAEIGEKKVPYLVVMIDEFSDWIINAGEETIKDIQQLASKSRACGIHIILAAQRPSSNVIRGEIKANFDTRFAFKTSSYEDSKIILGGSGAEKLVGRGDLLLKYRGSDPERIQAAFISDDDGEISNIVNKLKQDYGTEYIVDLDDIRRQSAKMQFDEEGSDDIYDELLPEVARFVVENETGSVNRVQTTFKIAFNRANRIFVQLEKLGIVSPVIKGRPREVMVGPETLERILEEEELA